MEFRYPAAVAETNTRSLNYLTKELNDSEAGREVFEEILVLLGNSVETYPNWHPILTTPPHNSKESVSSLSELKTYVGIDHTVLFVKGFVTCPYSEDKANQLMDAVNTTLGLEAHRLESPLYSDNAYPVVIQVSDIELEADGTIRSRDALAWCAQFLVKNARSAHLAETWWNMRSCILGQPHGSRSSLLVNQHSGGHMRKILEALNNSGMYGPIHEWSLEMLSEKKRKAISETLIRTAISCWDNSSKHFEFELRGETCKAEVGDKMNDGDELSVRVMIGDYDLCVSGYYYPEKGLLQSSSPNGKRALAEKFL